MGIQSIRVTCGEHAADVIRTHVIHIAVVDLEIPLSQRQQCADQNRTAARDEPAGPRVLQLLRRLPAPPPTVVIRPMQSSTRESARTLTEALREGAFTVLDQPLHLERMLDAMKRIVARHYANAWPAM